MNKYIIFLLGLPGSGKGQISQNLFLKHNIPSVSIGQLLRDCPNNNEIKAKMLQGSILDDDIIIDITDNKIREIEKDHNKFYIIDGFPRTVKQMKHINAKYSNTIFITLECDIETLKNRIIHRVLCSNCNAVYNTYYETVKKCIKCSSSTFKKRPDDSEEVFYNRIKTQKEAHDNIIKLLGDKVYTIESNESHEEIENSFMNIINKY